MKDVRKVQEQKIVESGEIIIIITFFILLQF